MVEKSVCMCVCVSVEDMGGMGAMNICFIFLLYCASSGIPYTYRFIVVTFSKYHFVV